jgi:uncharacterized protein (DUF1684 family)
LRRPAALTAVLAALALVPACGTPRSSSDAPAVGPQAVHLLTARDILRQRAETDAAYANPDTTPLTPEQREHFEGLDYYPPSPAYQFPVPLMRYPDPEVVEMPFTGGDGAQRSLRWGYFEFFIDGAGHRLQVYRPLDGEDFVDYVFVPFRDQTSGRETYGGGRYLEIPYDPAGWYALDFNLAFAPLCAHNPAWSCPMTPRENTLKVPIRAGERGSAHPFPSGAGAPSEDT